MYDIREDDLSGADIRALLEQHFASMLANSPPGTCHFLDFEGLKAGGVSFWSAWQGETLAGCGALREIDPAHGEIKSMRVADAFVGKGAGHAMLQHIIAVARARGYQRLSLETGTGAAFEAAHRLYERAEFERCPPFADYIETGFNHFMTKEV